MLSIALDSIAKVLLSEFMFTWLWFLQWWFLGDFLRSHNPACLSPFSRERWVAQDKREAKETKGKRWVWGRWLLDLDVSTVIAVSLTSVLWLQSFFNCLDQKALWRELECGHWKTSGRGIPISLLSLSVGSSWTDWDPGSYWASRPRCEYFFHSMYFVLESVVLPVPEPIKLFSNRFLPYMVP